MKNWSLERILITLAAIGVAVCAVLIAWNFIPDRRQFYTDAETIKQFKSEAAPRDILWQPPVRLPELINVDENVYEPRVSWDGLTLFFVRGKAGSNADIWFATRTPDGWTEPQPLDGVNSRYEDLGPEPSPDGRSLYFYSDRPGGLGGYDVWVAHRSKLGDRAIGGSEADGDSAAPGRRSSGSGVWQAPINLGPMVNSEFNDYGPAITGDGGTLYFSSNRPLPEDARKPDPDAWPATLREDLYHRTYDLYLAKITDAGAARAVPVMELNTPYNEGSPCISPVNDFVYFSSDRPGGLGGFDLYRTRRLHGEHTPPAALGAPVNTTANELDPGLTMGGYQLYFSSDRVYTEAAPAGADGQADGNLSGAGLRARRQAGTPAPPGEALEALSERPRNDGRSDQIEYSVYVSTSREVFLDAETLEKPPFDWAALAAVLPNLLWLLLALLLLLGLLFFLKASRDRKLSLLARCLLLSLLLHTLLMLLFAAWSVKDAVSDLMRKRGEIRIALASPAAGDQIATQIRGNLTEIDTPPPMETPIERVDVQPPLQPAEAAMATMTVERAVYEMADEPAVELASADAPTREIETSPIDPSPRSETMQRLELTMPTEVARINKPEVEQVAYEAPLPASAAERPHALIPTSQPAGIEREVTLRPADAVDSREETFDHSLADAQTMNDASPEFAAMQASAEIAAELAANVTPSRFDVATPAESAEPREQSEAAGPRVAAASPEAPRNEPAAEQLLPESAVAEQVALAPSESEAAASRSETSLARNDASLRDASAQPAAARASGGPASPANVSNAEIALATPAESATASDAEESRDIEVAAADSAPARGELNTETLTKRSPQAAAQVEIAPAGTNGRYANSESAFAASSDQVMRDAPPATTPAARPVDKPAAVAQRQPALSLPMLESSPTAERSPEATVQLAAHETPAPRAAAPSAADRAVKQKNTGTVVLLPVEGTNGTNGDPDEPTSLIDSDIQPRDARTGVSLAAAPPIDLDRTQPKGDRIGLRLPTEILPPDNGYVQRQPEQRKAILQAMGGDDKTEAAVATALNWLARHQGPDGRWSGHDFDAACNGCGGAPSEHAEIDVATTGLALLCFLGADHTHVKPGPYRENVRRGLEWLRGVQRADGDLRFGRAPGADSPPDEATETMYSHGIATIALSEAYGMSADPALLMPVRNATRFIVEGSNKRGGGWRYDPGQAGDTSVLGWQVMALKSAELAGIDVDPLGFEAAGAYMRQMTDRNDVGLYGYRPRQRPSASMTAEGMFVQTLLGASRGEPRMRASAVFITRHEPAWEEANTYFWYYATLALFQHQGEPWERWNAALKPMLLEQQNKDGPPAGSWDPVGEWTDIGGRVYQTALCTLMLEVYYRYLPLYSTPATVPDGIGTVRGRVTDVDTGRPLAGATLRLTLPDRPPLIATTGPDGRYTLGVPVVPQFFALSASKEGFVPGTANVPSQMLRGNTLTQNFLLRPFREDVIPIELSPEVHHLGNNRFEGSINSQFQKEAEGERYSAVFTITPAQLPPNYETAGLWLLNKGVQCPHELYINGVEIGGLDGSPQDGSFGEFSLTFDASLLREGANTIEIQAISCRGDLDDFEFVNLQIRLAR
jgi:hypothetical protein